MYSRNHLIVDKDVLVQPTKQVDREFTIENKPNFPIQPIAAVDGDFPIQPIAAVHGENLIRAMLAWSISQNG